MTDEAFDDSGSTYELGDVSHFREAGTKQAEDVQARYRAEIESVIRAELPEGAFSGPVTTGRDHFEFHITVTPGTSMARFHALVTRLYPNSACEFREGGTFVVIVPYVHEYVTQNGPLVLTAVAVVVWVLMLLWLWSLLKGHAGRVFTDMFT